MFIKSINGKKTSVGVISSGRGCLTNMDYVNCYLEYIQNFKDIIMNHMAYNKYTSGS